MSKRSVRRHHKERMKAKAKQLYRWWYSQGGYQVHPKAHHYADNLALCSCYGCGNPRKWFNRVTIKEYMFDIDANEQEKEYEN